MNRLLILVIFLLAGMGQVRAQQIKFEIGKDSVFNAADDYAQTSEGFDVDITKKNVVNLGMQIAQDIAVANSNPDEMASALANKSYYRQRVDLNLSSALPDTIRMSMPGRQS